MLIRENPCGMYPLRYERSKRGTLLITSKLIIATGMYAQVWA